MLRVRDKSYIFLAEEDLPYLSFIGNENFSLKTYNTSKNWNGTLEYSTNKSTWNTWDGTEISSSGSKLYLRGIGNTKITGNSNIYGFVFTGTDNLKINCNGNIENLLDYNTVSAGGHPTMIDYCYYAIFHNCTSLISAPELPATTLTNSCYTYMFQGCRNLTTAPELPATTLADYCYANMFAYCTNLTTPPQLPATTLAMSCYEKMFYGCTSLTMTPSLSATTLVAYCYRGMFQNCTNLITLPQLSATTLTSECYRFMFQGCTNIKLSTTKTGEYQTAYRIPKSGTGTTATWSLASMFTSTGGTFTSTPSINTTYYLSTSNTVV